MSFNIKVPFGFWNRDTGISPLAAGECWDPGELGWAALWHNLIEHKKTISRAQRSPGYNWVSPLLMALG